MLYKILDGSESGGTSTKFELGANAMSSKHRVELKVSVVMWTDIKHYNGNIITLDLIDQTSMHCKDSMEKVG